MAAILRGKPMGHVLFHTPMVRAALSAPRRLGPELLLLALAGAALGAMVATGRQFAEPYHEAVFIDLSLAALPRYTLLSLSRGVLAYLLSLVFTLAYGTISAHNPRAERVMIPMLDVLQAIPVLGFLPGLVLALIAVFPARELGLELACVIMIFTGQVWNMTFSFHGSLRAIPAPMREVATLQGLSGWQTFRLLELPAATIGLVWNSMMSMAGGWFFLTVNEAFTLGSRDYRLPGVGSYMSEAISRGDATAMVAAIVAMTVMIVLVDQVVWRPIVAWSQRFKVEEVAELDAPTSWVLDTLRRSMVLERFRGVLARFRRTAAPRVRPIVSAGRARAWLGRGAASAVRIAKPVVLVVLGAGALWGSWSLVRLLAALPLRDPSGGGSDWPGVLLSLLASFARTTAAVALGAAWALPAGILIGRSPRWSRRLQPVVQVVASFPAPMLFPLVTLLLHALGVPFGIGCVALMLLGAQWYILFNVIAGAASIPADLKEVSQVYRIGRWDRWRRLYLPCVFPSLLTGLVTAAGGAWNATIVSEYVQIGGRTYAAYGLGSLISRATAAGNFPLLTAGVAVMAVAVVLLNRALWKRLYRFAQERFSLDA
jgi:NitT/TauT family transport system permease protein